MFQLAAIFVVALLPTFEPARDYVELVEVNHYFDESGTQIFSQLIFYDWHAPTARYQVRAWRLLKHSSQQPLRDWLRGGYSIIWQDGETLRWVHAKALRQTWTQYDPEIEERARLPQEFRLGLTTRQNQPSGHR